MAEKQISLIDEPGNELGSDKEYLAAAMRHDPEIRFCKLAGPLFVDAMPDQAASDYVVWKRELPLGEGETAVITKEEFSDPSSGEPLLSLTTTQEGTDQKMPSYVINSGAYQDLFSGLPVDEHDLELAVNHDALLDRTDVRLADELVRLAGVVGLEGRTGHDLSTQQQALSALLDRIDQAATESDWQAPQAA